VNNYVYFFYFGEVNKNTKDISLLTKVILLAID